MDFNFILFSFFKGDARKQLNNPMASCFTKINQLLQNLLLPHFIQKLTIIIIISNIQDLRNLCTTRFFKTDELSSKINALVTDFFVTSIYIKI